MMKFKQGALTNMDGVKEDIIVTAKTPNKLKDIIIGSGMIAAGVVYLTVTAFKYGSERHEETELETMSKLGII